MVEIPESYLLTLSGLIFIPLFIYLVKNVMEQGNIRSKIEKYEQHLEDSKGFWSRFTNIEAELGFVKKRLENLESDIKHLFRRRDPMNLGDSDNTNNHNRYRRRSGKNDSSSNNNDNDDDEKGDY